jgi:hypothetical protein
MRTFSITFLIFSIYFTLGFSTEISELSPNGKRVLKNNPIPDFTKGGKPNKNHDWNLGPTGARGWIWGMDLQTDFARQILITKVEKNSPSYGILEVNDVILGVNGKKFNSDIRRVFGNAINEAEKKENKGKLNLIRWRKGKTKEVTIQLKVMGTYSKTSPLDCEKSLKILNNACEYISKRPLRKGITQYVNALGLLASGNEKYMSKVKAFAHQVKVKDTKSMSSWNMSYLNIFLSEYYLITKDPKVLPKIKEMALFLANGQSQVGTWGHGNAIDGLLKGYGAMCNPSLACAISLKLNQKCGVNNPEVIQAIKKSEIFFSSFVEKGNIPYGDHSPRDVHDSNGRCSMAVIFFDLLDNPDAYNFFARMTIASYGEREEGHTGNYWSFLWGPLGAMRAGPEAATAFINEQQWFFDLERRWDGGFTYQGGANMSGSEHTTPNWDTTGSRVLMYAMALKKLEITGRGLNVTKALTGKELQNTLLAGKGYSTWGRRGMLKADPLDKLPKTTLLTYLRTWSTPFRIRVAKALSRKKENPVPNLIEMLRSKNKDNILGGIYGLEYMRARATPAIGDLVKLLRHDDIWIRFRAGATLCSIGKAAREKAVPVMLDMALVTSKDDPREMHQRYISFVLWGGGVNGEPHGLIARDMKGLDQKQVIPAIQKLMRNTDGQTRALVAKSYHLMSNKELSPLWSDIVWAVKNPSPSGIMFNGVIREKGVELLVKNRFKEAIPLCAQYVKNMKQHGSQKRIYKVMDMLRIYGAAAKSELPNLYKTREYYKKNLGPGKPLNFPTWALNLFMKGLNEGIKDIENSKTTPKDLKSLADF